MRTLPIRGRAVPYDPPNRYERLHREMDPAQIEERNPKTQFLADKSRSVISTNQSPDVPFTASLNPYRGCEHGCIYCYARPTHEYLGFSSGLDFERRILVKHSAPELLRKALTKRSWQPRVIVFSGVTDPYQPIERRLGLTRKCLKVLRDFRNPVAIITKNHLVTRDIDILQEMTTSQNVSVTLSLTTLRNELHRVMEPRTSIPKKRLEAVRKLAEAGVPVGVNLAPLIPGLTDEEIPALLEAAADAGARSAGFLLLRLPGAVKAHFVEWLGTHFPDRKEKVLGRIRKVRNGKLNDPRFHKRFRGEGEYARQITQLFRLTTKRLGLNRSSPPLSVEHFRRDGGHQKELFAS